MCTSRNHASTSKELCFGSCEKNIIGIVKILSRILETDCFFLDRTHIYQIKSEDIHTN